MPLSPEVQPVVPARVRGEKVSAERMVGAALTLFTDEWFRHYRGDWGDQRLTAEQLARLRDPEKWLPPTQDLVRDDELPRGLVFGPEVEIEYGPGRGDYILWVFEHADSDVGSTFTLNVFTNGDQTQILAYQVDED